MAIAVQGITNGYGATLGAGETRYYAVPTGMAITMTAFGTDAVFRSTLAGQPSVENETATWSYAFGTPSNPLTAPQTRTALQPLILEVTAGIAGVTFTTSQGTPQAVWAEEIVADSGTISGILTVGGEVLTTETVETLTISTGVAAHDVQLTNDATDTLILSSTADGQGACKVQAGAITCTSLDAGAGSVLGGSANFGVGTVVAGEFTDNGDFDVTGGVVSAAGFGCATFAANATQAGFFTKAATPVTQPAAPVTLADVIAALQALGLVAT